MPLPSVIIYEWIRDHAPLTVKMTLKPANIRWLEDAIASALATAHAAGREAKLREAVEVLQAMKTAWESLGGNQHHSPKAVERWLWDDMKPVMDDLRAFLAAQEDSTSE
jgi:hypothetical protein